MEVVTSMSGLQSTSDCILSAALARDGWTQGLIESFDRSKTTLSLQLCASLFKTSHGAHLAYRKIAGQEITLPVKRNLGARISLSGVGNEAAGIDRGGIHCACGSTDASGYEIVFRHDNAVLDLTYAGPTSLTLSQFEQLVTRTNQRLH
jgi:hypothetical protein